MAAADPAEVAHMRDLLASRSNYVIGIDEVGLGALAGPLVVGGVIAPASWSDEKVKDSKRYSSSKKQTAHQKRAKVLEENIKPHMVYYCTVKLTSQEVDQYGIKDAWLRALWVVSRRCLNVHPDAVVVVDGDSAGSVPTSNVVALPKADNIVSAVSAASVLAKVERDTVMQLAHQLYPQYGFDNHVGYGTAQHMLALEAYGPCSLHRQSYGPIKKAVLAWQTKLRLNETLDLTR